MAGNLWKVRLTLQNECSPCARVRAFARWTECVREPLVGMAPAWQPLERDTTLHFHKCALGGRVQVWSEHRPASLHTGASRAGARNNKKLEHKGAVEYIELKLLA